MKVRWGILGTATIAREAVIPAMLTPPYRTHLEVTAIASRSRAKAIAVADAFGLGRAYGSYDDLLADPDIDAVYIPLPNHMHVPYSIRALESGKHVLCEKPIALSVAEAEELAAVSRRLPHLKLMEAFMYRHHPQWRWARGHVLQGHIGDVRAVHSFFSFFDDDPSTILHRPEWGGGGLMDIGCYSISLSRFLFDGEPTRVLAKLETDPRFGVDCLVSGMLEFPGGVATFTCSTEVESYQRVHVYGTRGRLELEFPFNPPTGEPSRGWLEIEGNRRELKFEICDQYGIQAELFTQSILDNTDVPTPIEDAIANMRVLEAVVRSGESAAWVPLENG